MSKDYFDEDTFKGKFQEIKGKLQQKWNKLTDDDLGQLKGNFNEFAGKMREKYGMEKDELKTHINDMLNNKTEKTTTTTTTTYKKDK